ncbi:hypothetical protein K456DRAFT_1756359 [Colletotrichum gloeosporioides 23]|nr:hypothetical protein K456DRAFT_1756359 [Colletotrichum gloeosporioides 23]
MAGSKTDDGLSSNRGRRGQLKTEYHDKPKPDIVSTGAGFHGQIWSAGPSPRIGSTKALCTRGHDPSKRAATVTFYGHGGVIPTRDALQRRLTGLAPLPHVLPHPYDTKAVAGVDAPIPVPNCPSEAQHREATVTSLQMPLVNFTQGNGVFPVDYTCPALQYTVRWAGNTRVSHGLLMLLSSHRKRGYFKTLFPAMARVM